MIVESVDIEIIGKIITIRAHDDTLVTELLFISVSLPLMVR
jgi:hypothetical protein